MSLEPHINLLTFLGQVFFVRLINCRVVTTYTYFTFDIGRQKTVGSESHILGN